MQKKFTNSFYRNSQSLIFRVTICTGRYQRKRHRFAVIGHSKFQCLTVARLQQFLFFTFAAAPNRAYCMNYILCRQIIPTGYLRFTGTAAVKPAAFFQQSSACCAVYGTVYTAASQKAVIGSVNNSVYF